MKERQLILIFTLLIFYCALKYKEYDLSDAPSWPNLRELADLPEKRLILTGAIEGKREWEKEEEDPEFGEGVAERSREEEDIRGERGSTLCGCAGLRGAEEQGGILWGFLRFRGGSENAETRMVWAALHYPPPACCKCRLRIRLPEVGWGVRAGVGFLILWFFGKIRIIEKSENTRT